jgi:hypothetical protein
VEQQSRNASLFASVRPCLAEVAHRLAAFSGEDEISGTFAAHTLSQQNLDGLRHTRFSAFVIF